ncbi:MAG: type I secretion C-terminal target domain-containing protein [Corticimicrobacter sp.]|uniref:type I secretion C-terminal target domain-containing protein n=1 Tax=Corticimicrobacter sp. TaxID=2678536 RepID=UPI0032DA1C46
MGVKLDVALQSRDGSGDITHVNGGSQNPDGFDVKDGKIYAIGQNVQLWYTDSKSGREGQSNYKEYRDLSQQEIEQIIKNSPQGVSQDNFKAYQQGNVHGSTGKSDVFILQPESSYSTRQVDNQGTQHNWQQMNAVTGNAGDSHPDVVFIPSAYEGKIKPTGEVPHPQNNQVNHIDSINLTGTNVSGSNQLAGVVYGNGKTEGGVPATHDYEIRLDAEVLHGSDAATVSSVIIQGLPAGAQIIAPAGVTAEHQADGSWIITGPQLGNLQAVLEVRLPAGSSPLTHIDAKAYAADPASNQQVESDTKSATLHAGTDGGHDGDSGQSGGSDHAGSTGHDSDAAGSDAGNHGGSDAGQPGSSEPQPQPQPEPTPITPPEDQPNLVRNGDFAEYSNPYYAGDGWANWNRSGSGFTWETVGKPYAGSGVNASQGVSSISQDVAGVKSGSVLAINVGWVDVQRAGAGAGGVSLVIKLGGVDYAVLSSAAQVAGSHDTGLLTIEALHGAAVSKSALDAVKTLSGDWWVDPSLPGNADGFTQILIRLPDDMPDHDSTRLTLEWSVSGNYNQADSIFVTGLQLVAPAEMTMAAAESGDEHASLAALWAPDEDADTHVRQHEQDPASLHARTVNGGEGDDVLFGSVDDDILTGGDGDDTFVWTLNDVGSNERPSVDVITDFGKSGTDTLDVRGLLSEGLQDGNVDDYLSVLEGDKGQTVIEISSKGKEFGVDQRIELQNVDYDAKMAQDIAASLKEDGTLKSSDY